MRMDHIFVFVIISSLLLLLGASGLILVNSHELLGTTELEQLRNRLALGL